MLCRILSSAVIFQPGMITAPPTTAPNTPRPQTIPVEMPPSKLRTGLNVYHPKPIPPPDVLPLTRIVSFDFYNYRGRI